MKLPVVVVAAALSVVIGSGLATAAVSILPLGDSITEGGNGGYRARMTSNLWASGVSFSFVGTRVTSGTVPNVLNTSATIRHEGHGGFRIDQLSANLDGFVNQDGGNPSGYWLTGGNGTGRAPIFPDIVTYMAGINDINQNYGSNQSAGTQMSEAVLIPILQARTQTLVNKVLTLRPNAKLMISNIIPYANGLLHSNVTGTWPRSNTDPLRHQDIRVNHYVLVYNAWLKDVYIPALQAAGKPVFFVDQYKNFINPDGTVLGWGTGPTDGYADYGLHPNQRGYDLMGATWATAVQQVIPEPGVAVWGVFALATLSLRRR